MNEKDEFSTYFRAIQTRFSRFYARCLTQTDLTLQQYALLNQLASSGTMSMTDASEKLLITKPAVTHLVDRLEKGGFIKRLAHPDDRRIYLLQISPKGKRVVRDIQSVILRFFLKTLNQFDAAEKKTIVRFYAQMSHTMDEILSHSKDK